MKLEKAQDEYLALFALDVSEFPAAYDASVRACPRSHAFEIIEGLTVDEVKRFTRELRAERRRVAKLSG